MKRKLFYCICSIAFVVFILAVMPKSLYYKNRNIVISLNVKNTTDIEYQLFYTYAEGNNEFNEKDSEKLYVKAKNEFRKLKIKLPVKNIIKLRVDFGTNPQDIYLKEIKIEKNKQERIINPDEIVNGFLLNEIEILEVNDTEVHFNSHLNDPHIYVKDDINFGISSAKEINYLLLFFVIFLSFMLSYILVSQADRRGLYGFVKDIFESKKIIFELAKKDLRTRYLGSYLGIIWAFIQPTCTIMILWFVFQVGFKSAPVSEFPFILWLICGMIPWFYISENIQSAASSVVDNSYLVKKVVFRVSALPLIRITSGLFIHLFFVLIMVLMFALYGYLPTIFTLQIIYYLFATIMLVLSVSWLTSALYVFLKDLGQIIAILIQFGLWLTPIFWSLDIVPEKYRILFKINPVYYIVEGYRDSLIHQVWFWNKSLLTINFWIIVGVFFVGGALVFKRLRPHFADVL